MGRRLFTLVVVCALVWAPTASAKPVFDCTDPVVRREYPAQCPEIGVPFLLGGGQEPHSGGGHCGGLCGLIRGVLGGLGGLL